MNIQEFIQKLPKTDLHCHLDGSMRPETILDLAREGNLPLNQLSMDELKKKLVCGELVRSLPIFLQAFDITCSVMQTQKALERIAFELVEDAAKENVRYLDIRYYPGFLTNLGMTQEQAIVSVQRGIESAKKKYDIEVGQIMCGIRTLDPSANADLARIAVSMKSEGVVGYDLAGAERGFPARAHKEAFDIAAKGGLSITIHAGEDDAPSSIWQAIDECGALRIGHGRTLIEDEKLIQHVIEKNIFVECCPSSNVQIMLTKEFSQHPVRKLLQKGVKVTLNTDNRLLTGIVVSDEYARSAQYLEMTQDEMKKIALNGFEAAFISADKKKTLIETAKQEIAKL
ncbi:MAG: adenosine deaminase [Proteobacteria bacterium]|jgi:adenosine deaminase|nr:adenosine deaminase [Pseudomonadota bacterium]